MKKVKLFCFGFGQVGKYFVKSLINKKVELELVTTNTKKTIIQEFQNLKFKSFFFSGTEYDSDLIRELNSSNKVLISISPKNQEDLVLKIFKKNFIENSFDWVTYLSATSVYGNKGGNWVDENSKTEPTSSRGIARLNAENNWLKYYKKFQLPVQILRLSGIYSLENNIIKRLKKGMLQVVEKEDHFFSRIHVEDIAEILTMSLTKFKPGEIFNISDDYPAPNDEIAQYASDLTSIALPKKIYPNDLESEMLKDFYKDSKKVSNKKMKLFFNYSLKYPTFKEGLEMIQNHIS
jgi:nucleoside-diphosphate-sugar epimerase